MPSLRLCLCSRTVLGATGFGLLREMPAFPALVDAKPSSAGGARWTLRVQRGAACDRREFVVSGRKVVNVRENGSDTNSVADGEVCQIVISWRECASHLTGLSASRADKSMLGRINGANLADAIVIDSSETKPARTFSGKPPPSGTTYPTPGRVRGIW